MRGEYVRGDGLSIPNNITGFGTGVLLNNAVGRFDETGWLITLCNAVPNQEISVADLNEPTIGVNNFDRQNVMRNLDTWPITGAVMGITYVQTIPFVWEAIGGPFDKPINRLALMTGGRVMSISAAMETPIIITPDTPIEQRTFSYRIYSR